jgi:hypothetical protein
MAIGRAGRASGRRRIGLTAAAVMIGIAAHAGFARIQRPVAAQAAAPWGVGAAAPESSRLMREQSGARRPMLALFCCGCALCRQTVSELGQAFPTEDDVLRIGVYQGTAAQAEQFRRDTRAHCAWLPDPLGQIHAEWRVDQCPALFAVSATGTVTAMEAPHSAAEITSAIARSREALRKSAG